MQLYFYLNKNLIIYPFLINSSYYISLRELSTLYANSKNYRVFV